MFGISIDNIDSFKDLTTDHKTYVRYYPPRITWYYSAKRFVPTYSKDGRFLLGGVAQYIYSGKILPRTIVGFDCGALADVFLDRDGNTNIVVIVPFYEEGKSPNVYLYCDKESIDNSDFKSNLQNENYGISLFNENGKESFSTNYDTFLIRGIMSKSNNQPIWFSQYNNVNKVFFLQTTNDMYHGRIIVGAYDYQYGYSVAIKYQGQIYVHTHRCGAPSWFEMGDRDSYYKKSDSENEVIWLICENLN